MPEEDAREIRVFSNIFLFLIILTVFMIGLFGIMSTMQQNNQSCEAQKYQDYRNSVATTDSTYVLSSASDYFLQEFALEDNNINNYLFCYTVKSSGNETPKVEIIDIDEYVLASEILRANGTGEYCTVIDKTKLKSKMFLGIKCTTCDAVNTLLPMKTTTGDNVNQVYYNDTITSYYTEALRVRVVGEQACANLAKQFFWWYLWIVFVCGIILAFLLGVDKMRSFLLKTAK